MEILDLSEFFKTKADAIDFSQRLSIIAQNIFETDFNLEKILMEQLGLYKKEKFLSLLRDNKINISSNKALKEFLEMIQNKISFMPVLAITIAFEPKEETLQALSDWFVLNKKQVLFEISVDRSLLAGVAIYYNSKYLDYSVKSRFEKVMQETLASGKESIIQTIKPIDLTPAQQPTVQQPIMQKPVDQKAQEVKEVNQPNPTLS